jgi:hypothetical protein
MFVEDDRERHRPRRGRMCDLTTQGVAATLKPSGDRRSSSLQTFHPYGVRVGRRHYKHSTTTWLLARWKRAYPGHWNLQGRIQLTRAHY